MQSISIFMDARSKMPIPTEKAPSLTESGLFRTPDRSCPTVLIVEDNDVVAEFLQCVFRAYGYQTLMATTPEQAVAHCQKNPHSIYALIADVRLGRFDGFDTSRTLLRMCPEMKVILTSGYPQEHLVRSGILPPDLGETTFIQKPFLPAQILAALKCPHLNS